MSEFGDMEKKAEDYAQQHPDQVDKGVGEAGKFADRETGGKYDKQIGDAAQQAEQRLGGQSDGGQSEGGQSEGGQSDGGQQQ